MSAEYHNTLLLSDRAPLAQLQLGQPGGALLPLRHGQC